MALLRASAAASTEPPWRAVGDEAAIAAAVAEACARHRVGSLVVPAGVPAAWVPGGVRVGER